MKKTILILTIFLSLFTFVYAEETKVEVTNDNPFEIYAEEVILYNLDDNQVIYEKDSEKKTQIASLTKIMTAIVAIENINDLDEKITIKSNFFKGLEEYAQAGFRIGQQVSYRELLYGVMLPSGAEAVNAIVLSQTTKENFVELMNKKAKELNLTNTHFDNAIGMDSKNNYSTAKDIAVLLMYALNNEEFQKIFTTREYKIERFNMTLASTLIKYSNSTIDVSNILGAKSGFTDGAGLCLASIATINDIDYLLVNLGSDPNKDKTQAVKDAMTIYNYHGDNYGYLKIIEKDQILKTIKNKFGHEKEYDIYATGDVSFYLKNDIDQNDLTYTYEGVEEINYTYKKGDKLGTVTIALNDKVLNTYDVYLNDELEYYHPVLYIVIFVSIIFILMLFRIIQIKYRKYKRRKKRKKRK